MDVDRPKLKAVSKRKEPTLPPADSKDDPQFDFILKLPSKDYMPRPPPPELPELPHRQKPKPKSLPFEKTGMYAKFPIKPVGQLSQEEVYFRQEQCRGKGQPRNPRPSVKHLPNKWRPFRGPGYDSNNPNVRVENAETRKKERDETYKRFSRRYPLHQDNEAYKRLRDEALYLLERTYPSANLYSDDHQRYAIVHSLEEFREAEKRIKFMADVKQHHFMSLDMEDINLKGDCVTKIMSPRTQATLTEPNWRFYFRRSYYLIVATLTGKVIIFHMPSLFGADIFNVLSTWRPVRYLIDYLPEVIKDALEDPNIINSGSAIVEQEFENRLRSPDFVPLANVCTRRVFKEWHDNGWSLDYEPVPHKEYNPLIPLEKCNEGFSLKHAMDYILDFKPVEKPIELEGGVLFQWNCIYKLISDPWKRHSHDVHYLYMFQDGLAPGAIALVHLLKILSLPRNFEFKNGSYDLDPRRSIGTAIQQIWNRHYRCLTDQEDIVEYLMAQFDKRTARKRKYNHLFEEQEDGNESAASQSSRPSGPKAVTPPQLAGHPKVNQPVRFTFHGMQPCPETYSTVSRPVYVKSISYEKGVTVVPSQQRGHVHFRYSRPYALQEASKINPRLPQNCCICDGDHKLESCPVTAKWDLWNARARENGKHMTNHIPSQYKSCIYPYCKDWGTHTREVCETLHHRCQLCKVMGHFEDQCKKLPNLGTLFGVYRTHAPYGVITKFGVPEPKALWEGRLAKDPNAQPRLHIMEWGFFPPPSSMCGNRVRPKLIIFDEELRFICRRRNIPVMFVHPAIAEIKDEQQRLLIIKAEPYYELFTADQTRDHIRAVCEQVYVPVTDEELREQSTEVLLRKIDELQNKVEEQGLRIQDLENENAQLTVSVQQHKSEQEQLLELEMDPDAIAELLA